MSLSFPVLEATCLPPPSGPVPRHLSSCCFHCHTVSTLTLTFSLHLKRDPCDYIGPHAYSRTILDLRILNHICKIPFTIVQYHSQVLRISVWTSLGRGGHYSTHHRQDCKIADWLFNRVFSHPPPSISLPKWGIRMSSGIGGDICRLHTSSHRFPCIVHSVFLFVYFREQPSSYHLNCLRSASWVEAHVPCMQTFRCPLVSFPSL